jgi:hypothetical protein
MSNKNSELKYKLSIDSVNTVNTDTVTAKVMRLMKIDRCVNKK